MSVVKLAKWGNSLGVRLPSMFLKALDCHEGELFELAFTANQEILLKPVNSKREGWKEAFNKAHEAGDDHLLMDESPTQFDKEEWTW